MNFPWIPQRFGKSGAASVEVGKERGRVNGQQQSCHASKQVYPQKAGGTHGKNSGRGRSINGDRLPREISYVWGRKGYQEKEEEKSRQKESSTGAFGGIGSGIIRIGDGEEGTIRTSSRRSCSGTTHNKREGKIMGTLMNRVGEEKLLESGFCLAIYLFKQRGKERYSRGGGKRSKGGKRSLQRMSRRRHLPQSYWHQRGICEIKERQRRDNVSRNPDHHTWGKDVRNRRVEPFRVSQSIYLRSEGGLELQKTARDISRGLYRRRERLR